jgi:hypothetical protein
MAASETTHAQRRSTFLKKSLADLTKVKDAKNKAYRAADQNGIPRTEVDKLFAEEVCRRYYNKTGESLNPIEVYGQVAASLTAAVAHSH